MTSTAGSLRSDPSVGWVVPHAWTDAGVVVEAAPQRCRRAARRGGPLRPQRHLPRGSAACGGRRRRARGRPWRVRPGDLAVDRHDLRRRGRLPGSPGRPCRLCSPTSTRSPRSRARCAPGMTRGTTMSRHRAPLALHGVRRWARPARPSRRHRRGARRDRPGRDGRVQPRAGDARVPAPRQPGPARPRRPGPPDRREAPRADPAAQPRRHPPGGARAARPRGAQRAQAAGPRHRPRGRRPRAARAAARQPAAVDRGSGQRAQPVRLEEPRGARGLRADQGPARPRDARPAVRRHEAGARERHRRRPRRDQRDAHRPQRPALQARARRGHPRGLRRLHGQARRLLPGEPAERRRADRRDGPARGCGPADDELDDRRAAGGADAARAAGVRLARAHAAAVAARREPPVAASRRGLGRLGAVRR